jgi:predicted PurR-regulated permease PerM
VPRVISFIVLLAIVLLVGAVFFRVMAQFFVPLFLAGVLVVIFQPLRRSIADRMPESPRLAALLTTFSIILVVVLPLVWLGWRAYDDFSDLLSQSATQSAPEEQPQEPRQLPPAKTAANSPDVTSSDVQQKQVEHTLKTLVEGIVRPIAIKVHWTVDDATIDRVVNLASDFVAKAVIGGFHLAIGLIIGLFILVVSLFFFLADGPAMIEAVMAVSPLDRRYEHELLERFAEVSRAVVVATLVAALAQGALTGIGYYFALPPTAPLFLVIALTTVCALIPIFGAFAVWGAVCIWLLAQGHTMPAITLAIYCAIVVAIIDNVMKPLILHGQSKLHPLLALLSILGGIEVFGPVGILVGPMLVSFLQALLNMLRKELDSFGGPVGPDSKPLAESVADAIHMVTAENAAANAASAGQLAAESGHSTSAQTPQPAAKTATPRGSKRKR